MSEGSKPQVIDAVENEEFSVSISSVEAGEIEKIVGRKIFSISRSMSADLFVLASQGWIGQFPLTKKVTVRVAPKVSVSSLLWMLDVAYRLDFKVWDSSLTRLATCQDLYTRFASILGKRVLDRVHRGIFRAYRDQRESLQVVRGRIDTLASARRLAVSAELACEYQEHTADVAENQILLFTLDLIARMGVQDRAVASTIRAARSALSREVSLRNVLGSECIGRRYSRLNDDYLFLHSMCRFFIEHCSPSLHAGDRDSVPFAIHMPRLFELFASEWLKERAPRNLDFRPQHRLKLDSNIELALDLDLLVTDKISGANLAVLDTKYKRTDRPSREDVAQVVLYALQAGVKHAFLVYPSKASMPFNASVQGIAVRSLVLDLSAEPRPNCEGFLQQLLAYLGT
jgi:5-methylcytosine-specific restriction enzyme subunit McrC